VRDKIAEIAAEDSPTNPLTRAWTVPITRPLVACELLVSSSTMTFAEFLRFPQTKELFGSGDTGVLLEELLKAREFHYFGVAAGKFRKHKTRTRKTLTKYVRRAYRGSARGVAYWGRVAKLLWLTYEHLLRLKYWAQRTERHELARMERKVTRSAREGRRLKARHQQKHENKRGITK
jgi:hypothetical protein